MRIDGPAAVPALGAAERAAPAGAAATPAFQALLERLQQLAAPRASEPVVDDADTLRDAVAAADRSFTTAMDLRRQLEDAFRRHAP
jgi:hypothetical protein